MDMVGKPTLAEVNEKESFAHILSGLVSIYSTFKTGWDTYLELMKKAYPKILKFVKLRYNIFGIFFVNFFGSLTFFLEFMMALMSKGE